VDQFARNPYGYVLHGPTAEAATFNGTSVDLTGGLFSLTNGAQAHLHILAADGVAWTLKVQHSANDSAWADLITFSANGTAITAERATASGTINRYVRMIGSKAGGTSLTAVCTFSPVNAP
jgi:hypothetical protein